MPYSDPDEQREYQRDWVALRRLNYFKDKLCIDCGSAYPLELDHKDPNKKVSHRIWSWSETKRNVELEKCVVRCHSCHNKKTKENQEYGHVHKGISHANAVVNAEQLQEIRSLYATGKYTYPQLASMFNIGRSTVGHMVTRYHYKD